MSTTGRLLALITLMVVELQMFGGEICHVHVELDHAGRGNNRQNEPTQHARDF